MAAIPAWDMTPEQFATLPPAVQRKCFSTTERLRYTQPQQAIDHPHPPPANYSHLARGFLDKAARPLVPRTKPKSAHSFAQRLERYASRHAPLELTEANLTPEFARFYDRLPDKIKRGQFSAQERGLLDTRRSDRVNETTEVPQRRLRRRSTNRSLPSLRSDITSHASSLLESDDLAAPETNMDAEFMSTFKWIDESEPDLTLDDYHTYVPNNVESKTKAGPTLPFRRNRSYTNFSTRAPAARAIEQRSGTADGTKARKQEDSWNSRFAPAAPPVPALPKVKPVPSPLVMAPMAAAPLPPPTPTQPEGRPSVSQTRPSTSQTRTPVSQTRPQVTQSRPSMSQARVKFEQWGSGWAPMSSPVEASHQRQESVSPPVAEHYLSPEARLKLRFYLATPSRFDEALQHGFATQASPVEPARPSTSRSHSYGSRQQPSQGLTFLNDETTPDLSVAEDNQAHSRKGSSFYASTDSPPPSSPRSAEAPVGPVRDFEKEPDAEPDLGTAWNGHGREMTLRMTLTRPDLRADENILYPAATPYVMAPTPRSRFGGAHKEQEPNFGAISVVQNPLSLQDLFADQAPPLPAARSEKSTFRKLFSRKW